MRVLGSTEEKITMAINGENTPHLKNIEKVLVHCNIVDYKYQRDSLVLSIFVPNKSFGQLLNISPTNHIYTETFRSEFSYIEVWLTNQNSNSLEKEDRANLTLVINHREI